MESSASCSHHVAVICFVAASMLCVTEGEKLELAVIFSVLHSAAKAVTAKGLNIKVPVSKALNVFVVFLISNSLLQIDTSIIP